MFSYNKLVVLVPYILLIVCMGFATFIEKLHGVDYASQNVYASWWFIGLWGILTLVSLAFLVNKKVYKRLAVMLLHISFMLILVGALVTHITSKSGTIHLRKGVETNSFIDKEGNSQEIPFAMNLSDFEVINYPGTNSVMDYCCKIEVTSSNTSEQIKVSMNNIGKYSDFRFYQSAYDSDLNGTTLLVAYDPYGITITYIGYLSLLISLIWTIFSKHTRIRELYRKATMPMILLFVLCTPSNLKAKELDNYNANFLQVDKTIADELGSIAVLYNGRICPLNTAATEFVTKLSGKSTWNGYSANEIFVGWMIYYTQWETQKLIKIKNSEVQTLLGIEDKWASVRNFYTSNHTYKLSEKSNDSNLPVSTRKAIREADEKLQVVSMFYNSEMLHIFPLSVDGKMDWYTPGSTELPLGTPEAEFQFINHVMDQLTQCILTNDVEKSKQIIAKIKLYQREKAGEIMPSSTNLSLETFYNKIQQQHWITYLFLTLSLVFCLLSLAKGENEMVKYPHVIMIFVSTLWLSVLFLLRWIISGHVPMSNGAETMLFMAWITLVITLLLISKLPVVRALGPVVSAFCMLVSTIAFDSPQVTNLMPVLQSPLLSIHVAMVMISYALFAMMTLMAIYSLVLYKTEQYLELKRITALSMLILYPSVSLLTMGIFIGAVWANVSWGAYWSWDPKETWALITLMIYAIPLHRSFMSNSPIKYHSYILLSFLTVLMTYFGVNYFLTGMHSYA